MPGVRVIVIGLPGTRLGRAIIQRLDVLLDRTEYLMTQNDEVRELVTQLGGDVAEAKSRLAGVAGDVSYLKAKIDALPVGQPLDEQTVADLRDAVAGVAEVTDGLAALDESTTPDEAPPAEPTE